MTKICPEDLYNCNHHHKITDGQELVNFGNGTFVADKERIPLLKALNEAGLRTRTHCYGHGTGQSFISIILDKGVSFEVREVDEIHSSRSDYDGAFELLVSWQRKD